MVIEKAGIAVHRFTWDYLDANTYAIESGGDLLVIDPTDTLGFWRFLNERKIRTASVILSHEHFDHISGLNQLRERAVCTVYAHKNCSENIGDAGRNLSRLAEVIAQYRDGTIPEGKDAPMCLCEPADVTFEEKLPFDWHGHEVVLFHTPGHSQGSICAVLDGKLLFSGDTLMDTPAVTRLPGGNTKQYLEAAVPKLKMLAGRIEYVLPGHGDSGYPEKMLLRNGLQGP